MLELHKAADKSGDRLADGTWPLLHVALIGEAPTEHGFSDLFVGRALSEGWGSFENMGLAVTSVERDGETLSYERNPVVRGDVFVLALAEAEGPGELRYRVDEHPGIYEDDSEAGYRVSHEYRCRLEKN